ncbi:hypothetical protein K505DRAFT_23335 [Melanomma pulvis-pyrius CBS 109.77]|uniref:Uncharacterized protein n=1 Tax=Melanomma pulvis-pyrius CBS 109.77 TaxID=1314802 RepID=A0A6A6XDY8_9PLEO|nr:hypothetical protein K505DRAFT_23335 [Melanomma pulvis-pyrius CBS 109.77]
MGIIQKAARIWSEGHNGHCGIVRREHKTGAAVEPFISGLYMLLTFGAWDSNSFESHFFPCHSTAHVPFCRFFLSFLKFFFREK